MLEGSLLSEYAKYTGKPALDSLLLLKPKVTEESPEAEN
jgi:hypothetical protein